MKSVYSIYLALALALVSSTAGLAQTRNVQNDYSVASSPYSYVAVSASNSSSLTNLLAQTFVGNGDDGFIVVSLPFAFSFNGDYAATTVRVYTNGSVQVPRAGGVFTDVGGYQSFSSWYGYPGSGANGTQNNYKNNALSNMILGWACDFDLTGSSGGTPEWYYAIQGSAPNRRAVFEWRNARVWNVTTDFTFQIILNETSNAIDIVYGTMASTFPVVPDYNFYTGLNEGTSSDGTVTAKSFDNQSGNYLGSVYNGSSWVHSSSITPDPLNANSTAFPANQGLRYCYLPNIAANPPSTALFDAANDPNDRVNAGTTLTKQYTVSNPSTSTAPAKIVAQISGAGASAYNVSPSLVSALAPGASQTFTVNFVPSGFGDYNATMNVYVSTIDGVTCPINKTPVAVQLNARVLGLTAQVSQPIIVDFGQVGINTVNIKNIFIFKNDATTPLTYYIQGPVSGSPEFSITGATGIPKTLVGTVNPGAFVFLPVQFTPTISGPQSAALNFYYTNQAGTTFSSTQTISLIGEGVPSRIKLTREGETVHFPSGSAYAQSKFGDVGEQNLMFNFTVGNTGLTAPIHLQNFKFYTLDVDNPVNNRFRVMWSGGSFGVGVPISSNDFTVQQLIAGQYVTVGSNDVITISAGSSVPMRIVFTPARRGTKFVRMFFNTDATTDNNFVPVSSLNVSDVATAGLQSYDFYGITARNSQIAMIPGLLFGQVSLGDSAMGNIAVKNVGDSRLLVESSTLKLLPGDADFSIESVFPAAVQDNGRYVIPIGSTATITVKFKPRAGGTRQSTLYFVSNDSSDIGEVGHRYISLVGEGLATTAISVGSLEGIPVFNQDTAVVDDPSSYVTKTIDISNIGKNEVLLKDVVLEGVDKDSYKILSKVTGKLSVGSVGEVTVQFAPKSGGGKSAQLVVKSNAQAGDEIVALTGFAGVRTIGALTANAFGTDSVIVNEGVNQTIIVKNTGTVNLDVSSLEINGTSKDDYHFVGITPGAVSPGGTVNIEVELKSGTLGAKSAELIFGNNSTNAPALSVALNGYVGTRSYTVNPEQFSISTSKGNDGQYAEKGGCVEVKNTGDISMKITDVQLTGAGADQFVLGTAPSGLIGPGEAVQVCFTYKPTSDAVVQATLTITTNGETSQVQILLNGTATGVSETGEVSGYMVSLHPNPVMSGKAEIVYRIGISENVRIEVYTMVGERVAVIDAGMVSAGDHRVEIGAEDLPSGTYYYRLVTPHFVRSHTFQIIK